MVLISGKWTETKHRKGAFSPFPQRVHCGRVVCITAVDAKSAQGGQLDGVLARSRPRLALFPSPPRPNPSCVAQGSLPRRWSLRTLCLPFFATADTFFNAWRKKPVYTWDSSHVTWAAFRASSEKKDKIWNGISPSSNMLLLSSLQSCQNKEGIKIMLLTVRDILMMENASALVE